MLEVILISNYSMKDELSESLTKEGFSFKQMITQDIEHIERYPIDDVYDTIIIQSANAIKKIDSSNNYIFSTKKIYGIGPNCKYWVEKKFGCKCAIPDKEFTSDGLIEKMINDKHHLGKILLLKGEGGKETVKKYLDKINAKYKIKNVYKRLQNPKNIESVINKTNKEVILIAFSRSSIEPVIDNFASNLKNCHFFVLDKSDEEIIQKDKVRSLTKIIDIYDVDDLTRKIKRLCG